MDAGINIRPYAIECLKAANEHFQVVVFTASHQAYADVVLDYLDPTGELIQARLYRDSCIQPEPSWFKPGYEDMDQMSLYIKDLRIIRNRDLSEMVIVDNAVYSFGFQLDNGVPIIPFYKNKDDEELHHLIFYLKCLSQIPDMRTQNKQAFQLASLDPDYIEAYLNEYYETIGQQDEEEEESYEVNVRKNQDIEVIEEV